MPGRWQLQAIGVAEKRGTAKIVRMNPPSTSSTSRKSNAPVTVGSRAPDFELPAVAWPDAAVRQVSLDDYRDRWLVLLFYPRDFSMVCPTELTALSRSLADFSQRDCDILGVSTDTVESHLQWLGAPRAQGGLGGLAFPLASDVEGEICQAYGVYIPRQNMALRGLFIIDPNGVLQYQVVHNLSVGRRSDEVLRVLDGLQSGGLCPENWSRDDSNLDPTSVIKPNSVLGQYRIEKELGSGTFGVVYLARDLTLKRRVALKVFKPTVNGAPRRLLDEARSAAALNHPNVCTIFSVDDSDGVSMIVMEYVEGQPLGKKLESGPLPASEVKQIVRQIASGMAAAHAKQIVHGDLKPCNIMLAAEGHAKIMDFGLAQRVRREAAPSIEETGTWHTSDPVGLSGTPAYMSPEQFRAEPSSPKSDVFSLGLIMYEMLKGERAIRGGNLLDLFRQIDSFDANQYATGLPAPFDSLVRQTLTPDPAERTITMQQIAEQLA